MHGSMRGPQARWPNRSSAAHTLQTSQAQQQLGAPLAYQCHVHKDLQTSRADRALPQHRCMGCACHITVWGWRLITDRIQGRRKL
jgi:hypothetical protein